MPVSELFYSFQGEGVNLGRRALFVRFMDCNLTCGYSRLPGEAGTPAEGPMLCDTEYTWNSAKHDLTTGRAAPDGGADLGRADGARPLHRQPGVAPVDLIVASGGEPLLRKEALLHLARPGHADRAADGDRDQRHHLPGRAPDRGRGRRSTPD